MRENLFLNKKNKTTKNNRKGFSLVEVMSVIAIIGIVSVISWEMLGGAKKTSDVTNACEQVASMINKTRGYALSGRTATATVRIINNNTVTINSPAESFTIPGGVTCTNATFTYAAPNAVGGSGTVTCTANGGSASRTIDVSPLRAACL